MSKAQWGHGFHTGRKSASQKGYVGLWFHSFNNDGSIGWQGQIIKRVDKTHWAVQLYSWFDGSPTDVEIIDKNQLDSFKFYVSDDQMCEAWVETLPPEDQDWARRSNKALRGK